MRRSVAGAFVALALLLSHSAVAQFARGSIGVPSGFSQSAAVAVGCTITNITLSNASFTGGASSGTVVGAISVPASGCTFSGTLSLGGTDAASFQLSSTSLPSNLETNGVVGVGSYSISLTATYASASNSPFTKTPITITGNAAFAGIGNQFSGAKGFWGMRGYNSAYATGSNPAFDYQSASGIGGTQTGVILTSGAFDIATANTFAGLDTTCSGTIASTTLSCTGAAHAPTALSTLTGTGITQPSWIASCGTFTAGTGTCTLNAAQSVGVAETITMQYELLTSKAWDQSSTGNHLTASGTARPQLLPNCGVLLNSGPCLWFNGSTSALTASSVAGSFSAIGLEVVVNSTTSCGGFCDILYVSHTGASTHTSELGSGNSANNNYVYSGVSPLNSTASNNAWHIMQGIPDITNGVNRIDGNADATGGTGAAGTTAATISLGAVSGASNFITGGIAEATIWGASPNSTQRTNIYTNGKAYYGTP